MTILIERGYSPASSTTDNAEGAVYHLVRWHIYFRCFHDGEQWKDTSEKVVPCECTPSGRSKGAMWEQEALKTPRWEVRRHAPVETPAFNRTGVSTLRILPSVPTGLQRHCPPTFTCWIFIFPLQIYTGVDHWLSAKALLSLVKNGH